MKYPFCKALAFFVIVVGMALQTSAQTSAVSLVVTMTDGEEVVYQLTEGSHLSFEEGTSLIIDDGSGDSETLPLSNIRKIVCSELTGTDEQAHTRLQLFPNPSRNHFYIKGLSHDGFARIYTLDGRLLKSFVAKEGMMIDIHELNSGMYLLHINGQTLKLMKL